ncbi:GTPase-associated protein 1-related protein [Actinokineospora sp. NBRC 105648]|uniref:GTPase-associated protein 1-related protein n=1 Tax=Actinokineospora sp. NBRC 105648 TaxID=3032206 RepID=UPI0024A31AE1|nr:GTPase-associated protein 1-related protein [Actinokineospora sp. NBRC 105648]GLZ42329.1 hypothetical protein Acsp05_59530 [Actinokineospora sp. NBRC 105648]
MSEPGFRSLYYTDCKPGQGLRGGAGFQFQSVSAGVDHETMALAQRSSLYEAPVAWMRERRPVADYPPSLTHLYDGAYVTARGVYLGTEANGVREGNQFTHAVATTDPDAYGQTRPAQLWDAPWWAESPAPGTECDPVEPAPEQGPWSVDAIREWVLGRPDGEEWLTAVVSAFDRLDGPDRKRVLFIGDDAAAVLGWIAAGTLLLPQRRALRVGFRVFATNPRYSQQDVLALHPDWAGGYAAPGQDGEYAVFNLVAGTRPEAEPTAAAAHWVPRFLRLDPYDVLDAVELAAQLAGPVGAADRLAACVTVLGEPVHPDQVPLLVDRLAAGADLSTEDVVDPVARAVLGAEPDLAALRAVDTALTAHPQSAVAGTVRAELLRAEVEAVVGGHAETVPPVPPARPWARGAAAAATALLETHADRVAAERMDWLLRVAAGFALSPQVGNFTAGAHRFAHWWVDNPRAEVDPGGWPERKAMLDQLRDELHTRLAGGRVGTVHGDVFSTWWALLREGSAGIDTELDRLVSAAVVAHDPVARPKVLRRVLDQVSGLSQPAASDLAWEALFSYTAPTMTELATFLDKCPPGRLVPAVSKVGYEVLERAARTAVTAPLLDLLRQLAERESPPEQPFLRGLHSGHSALRVWLTTPRLGSVLGSLPLLRGVDEPVLRAHADQVMALVLHRLAFPDAARLVDNSGAGLATFLAGRLPREWTRADTADETRRVCVALAMVCAQGDTSERVSETVLVALQKWVRIAPPAEAEAVGRLLRTFADDAARTWPAFVEQARSRGKWRKTGRPAKGATPKDAKGSPPKDKAPSSKAFLGMRNPFKRNGDG